MSSTIDLEKELTCSICTDVFFQPLTLLDCLHTFCGSCLKEWFSWQAASATHNSRNATPYTCPSCRAPVRAARPNANVTTLLDMYLQANPSKGKTDEEKAEMRKNYTPGDDVIPPVEVHAESEGSEDERLMDDVRQMSVADLNPAVEANRRDNRRHRRERDIHADSRRRDAANARRRQEAVERNVAHQPSLRSLLSASTDDPAEVREIIQSIMSSGVLDGIDLEALTAEQEDELTEHIIAAVHRRQAAYSRDSRDAEPGARARPSTVERSSNRSTPPRNRQPVSGPHLIEQWLQDSAQATRQLLNVESRLRLNRAPIYQIRLQR
ncbi:hypothetical protein AMS68_005940 [Peltaster fructicola]|uniref:RING-type domain-containing protein n=1 Tax=Peltaster fructicola TaxID=286661 RepID=A0A6H0Y085_9PEZI|nr:hypothetical protein AMS68_005940 [Peltaster fructicola]